MAHKENILQRIKETVAAASPDATVILYGSYARGDNREDSDIDLLILLEKDKVTREDKHVVTHPLYDIELATGVLISPIVYSKAAWAAHRVTPFYENVNREGRRL